MRLRTSSKIASFDKQVVFFHDILFWQVMLLEGKSRKYFLNNYFNLKIWMQTIILIQFWSTISYLNHFLWREWTNRSPCDLLCYLDRNPSRLSSKEHTGIEIQKIFVFNYNNTKKSMPRNAKFSFFRITIFVR